MAKRSVMTAAHLVDEVLPVCAYRQWTISVPFDLRYSLLRDSALFARVVKVFVRSVFAWQKQQAKVIGYTDVHTGSITFAQRFGSLLQVHPHCHTWIPDGVFGQGDDGALRFVPLAPPTDDDVDRLCR